MAGLKLLHIMIEKNAKTGIVLPFHAKLITKMEIDDLCITFAKLDPDRGIQGSAWAIRFIFNSFFIPILALSVVIF